MALTSKEKNTEQEALLFARANKKTIAKKITDTSLYISEDLPVSVFMAGSPGAGKTEASIELLAERKKGVKIVRIDADDLRREFSEYNGSNSALFQKAVSVLVDNIHDLLLKQRQSFLLDGTLSHYKKAKENIERSLKRRRVVQILYVYQYPELAWNFVIERETLEGRRILPEHFIEQYFAARDVVNRLKSEFKTRLNVDLLMKNIDHTNRFYQINIDRIDHYIPEKYTRPQLKNIIKI